MSIFYQKYFLMKLKLFWNRQVFWYRFFMFSNTTMGDCVQLAKVDQNLYFFYSPIHQHSSYCICILANPLHIGFIVWGILRRIWMGLSVDGCCLFTILDFYCTTIQTEKGSFIQIPMTNLLKFINFTTCIRSFVEIWTCNPHKCRSSTLPLCLTIFLLFRFILPSYVYCVYLICKVFNIL